MGTSARLRQALWRVLVAIAWASAVTPLAAAEASSDAGIGAAKPGGGGAANVASTAQAGAAATAQAGAAADEKPAQEKSASENKAAAETKAAHQVAAGPYGVALDKTNWQAFDGLVRFNVTGDVDPSLLKIVTACFRWDMAKPTDKSECVPATVVRLAGDETTAPKTARFEARVPLKWLDKCSDPAVKNVIPFIPSSTLVVTIGRSDKPGESAYPAELTVGITAKGISVILTVLFLFIIWVVFRRFADDIRVPKTGFVLRLVAQQSGWASLGKLQILLWTVVVGAGAVFVMTLNGALIEISPGILVLLGISGAAAVASQVKTKQETAPAPPTSPPSIYVRQVEAKVRDGVMLTWNGPTLAPADGAYTVQHKLGNSEWFTETTTVSAPRLRVLGLAAGDHEFRVCAANAAGEGVFSEVAKVTVPFEPEPPGPPASDIDLVGEPTSDTVKLKLREMKDGRTYHLQVRPRNSDRNWEQRKATGSESGTFTVPGLQSDTIYEFRVVAHDARGYGPPSRVQEVRTGRHMPRWSDLVTQTTRAPEIDVSRLQMLVFTVVSALFVLLNIWKMGVIPPIDSSYLLLMGISNGVYIGAKFLGSDT